MAGALVWGSVALKETNAADLECPQPGDLHTPPLAAEIDNLLPKGLALGQADKLATAITLMREHDLTTDNAINHLVALYCPTIASETDLSSEQKLQRIRDFAAKATRLALASNGVEEVIFDVPLNPNLAEVVKELAGHAGVSVETWIAQAAAAAAR